MPTAGCFHCGEALPATGALTLRLQGANVSLCCTGCRAAAQLVEELGLQDFYRFRTAASPRPDIGGDWAAYDDPALQASLTHIEPRGRSIVVMIDGVTCAACGWLITRSVLKLHGVVHVSVNAATGRAHLIWDGTAVKLSRVLGVIASLGYRPQVVTAGVMNTRSRDERRSLLKRLAVAGLGMMQVMMFAVALYAGDMNGMEPDVRTYLRIVSMLVATPVMLYGGWPYFTGAAHGLSKRTVTMDLPVSLGLLLAYGASVVDTWRHAGEVYFDSVTMFIFFLTVARYVEMMARHQSTRVTDALCRMLPAVAHQVRSTPIGDEIREVAVSRLMTGDRLLVRAGDVVPADGELIEGKTSFDEALLTGESVPIKREVGDRVTAGTVNLGSPVQMRITAVGRGTVISGIVDLLHRSQAERPRITRAADRNASAFLLRVVLGAVAVGVFWSVVDPQRAFDATLAVLVVACPCAFSLATLVAVASANAALARQGVLVAHPDAIEGLAKVTRVVFDKTGTLTQGKVSVAQCRTLAALSESRCTALAAALEATSEHVIARAFAAVSTGRLVAHSLQSVAGGGVSGIIEGTAYAIGTRAFVDEQLGLPVHMPANETDASVFLASEHGDLASFTMADEPRAESARVVAALRQLGLGLEILSGDAPAAVRRLAAHCGITTFAGRRSPREKLERVKNLTADGAFIAMVGDGVNDAPVLAGAGVSIAMSKGSPLALASSDLILIGDSLRALPGAFTLARRAAAVMRQNLRWAAAYNLTAMPLAAMGWVPPWAAAIGMSTSSILVVLNSLRLLRDRHTRDEHRDTAPRPMLSLGGSGT